MKKQFQFSVKIKHCDTKFHPELPPGVISSETVEFKGTEEELKGGMFKRTIMNHKNVMVADTIEVIAEEIK